jgi:hypothetical protein
MDVRTESHPSVVSFVEFSSLFSQSALLNQVELKVSQVSLS